MAEQMDTYSDLDSDSDDPDVLTHNFNAAAKHVQKLVATAKPSTDALLSLYALYKVATVGKCNTSRPNWYDIQGKKKWDMWHQMGDLAPTDAMAKYVRLVERLDPKWDPGRADESSRTEGWVNVSSMVNTDSEIQDSEKTVFDFVRDGNVGRVREMLQTPTLADVNVVDEEGLGLLHWACDRGNVDMLTLLLDCNANVNLQAADGQTGLHYAASCGHAACVDLLLRRNARVDIKDSEDATAKDMASDTTIFNMIVNCHKE